MLRSKIKVFDLDDTLYRQFSFVESGFHTVSLYLSPKLKLSAKKIYEDLMFLYQTKDRGKIFDILLLDYKIFSKKSVNKLIQVYRFHEPMIKLDSRVRKFLEKMKNERLYLVTDGHKLVQQKKIQALDISKYFSRIFITNQYGLARQKPSLYCFDKILNIEKAEYDKLVYIGDNPIKDFVNLNKVGATTIQSLMYVTNLPKLPLDHYAQYRVNSFEELFDFFK